MAKIKLDSVAESFPKFLQEIYKRAEFRGKPSNPWELFQRGFYWDFHADEFRQSISKDLEEAVVDLLNDNQYILNLLSTTEVHWICTLFLQSFFVGKISDPSGTFSESELNTESKYNQSSLSETLESGRFEEAHTSFLEKLINFAYAKAKGKEILWVFPLYFFDLSTSITDFEFMETHFFHNNDNGIELLRKRFPEVTDELVQKITSLSKGESTSLPAFTLIKTKGSHNKGLETAAHFMQKLFSFLKVVIHKNAIPGTTSFGDNFFRNDLKELDGIFHVIIQEDQQVRDTQVAWIDVEKVNNMKNDFYEKNYYYVDNFFQNVYVPVRSGVACGYIHPKNLSAINEDLKFLEEFFDDFKGSSIHKTLSNAASFFAEARREANPIKQVILGTTAIETVISSETGGERGVGTTDVFKNRLSNLVEYAFLGNWDEIKSKLQIGSNTLDELKELINNFIYKYRSDLVHGRNRKITYYKNNLILNIAAIAIFYTAKLAKEKGVQNSEKVQELMDGKIQ